MPDIWVISDTHFGHENIIKFCDRPFTDSMDMNIQMLDRWNSVVKPGDKVYHLGDVYMGNASNLEWIFERLHGRKRLLLGNHDNGKDQFLRAKFEKIDLWRVWKDHKILMTHVPVHEQTLRRAEKRDEKIVYTNVHGHIHSNKSPPGPYRCVCVEHINYTPIHIEELRT